MRLALLIYGSLETISGGYLYDRQLVSYLRRQGDTVEIVSLPWRHYAAHLGDNLSNKLLARLAHLPVDLCLQDELNHPSLFWLNRRLKRRLGERAYPLVGLVHHLRASEARPAWQNRLYRIIERRYLTSLDGMVYNSQATRQVVQAVLGTTPPGVVALPAGDARQPQITSQAIEQRARQSGPLRLLALGNVIPRKGLHTLLEALSILADLPWELNIVGSLEIDLRYVARLRRQIATCGLQKRVALRGALDEQQLDQELRTHHILTLPSSYEGFGIVYLEGMGYGLPAIGSQNGGAVEIISDGKDGYLVPSGETAVLAERLRALLTDRTRLLAMSLAARQRYLAHPTWDQTGARVRAFLKTLVEN